MEVIGAGFGRTGTMSLKVALEQLGFGPCHHAIEIFNDTARVPLWEAARDGEQVGWDRLLEGYRSTVDWPCCTRYEDLMEAYPQAKVILTVRDPDRWYESVLTTIYDIHGSGGPGFMPPMEETPAEIRPARELMDRVIFLDTFDNRFEDRSHAIAVFNAHNEAVRRHVPAERLLVYEVGEGWGPLCGFLGVDVPADAPFPRLNDREAFMKLVDERTEAAAHTE